jgi:hypothetical protein
MTMLRLTFARGADSSAIRHEAGRVLAAWQEPDLVDDSLVVVAELVQNVLQHTDSTGELSIRQAGGHVLIEVADGDARLPEAQAPDTRRLGGRGLLLVAALSRSWGSRPHDGGKVVWAEMATA